MRHGNFLAFVATCAFLVAGLLGYGVRYFSVKDRATLSKPVPQIARGRTATAVEGHFDLGSNAAGKTAYNRTVCGSGYCAYLYQGKGWTVILRIDSISEPPHGPPLEEDRG